MKFVKHPNQPDTFVNLESCIQMRKVTYAHTEADTEYCICFDTLIFLESVNTITFSYAQENLRDMMFRRIVPVCERIDSI